jgi:uncharacterized protein YegL
MKKQYTHIAIVLDKSGSMASVKSDTIGGYNSYIGEQKEAAGTATVSLALFDTKYNLEYDFVPISEVKDLTDATYRAGGGTALHDAIGLTINSVGKKLSEMKEEDRPEKVLFVVMTDGEENSSLEFNGTKVGEMIDHQTNVYKWDFAFIGANQDAILTGSNLGIRANSSLNYEHTSKGTHDAFATLSRSTALYRAAVADAEFSFDTTSNTVAKTPTSKTI